MRLCSRSTLLPDKRQASIYHLVIESAPSHSSNIADKFAALSGHCPFRESASDASFPGSPGR